MDAKAVMLELQFYNICHLKHHVGELSQRLWAETGIKSGWVGHSPGYQ